MAEAFVEGAAGAVEGEAAGRLMGMFAAVLV